ncbi:MAG: diguanylate cyclase [Myxococcaceae bacterium]|nr:diguanylate cyclase [Myxococcaceae bacterium]
MPPRRTRTLENARRVTAPVKPAATVLLADDDAAMLKRIREHLAPARYQFLEASDGAAALSLLREHRPDLLLMDVEMPGLGGVEVCRIVKANQTETGFGFVPVILMTARRGGKVEGLELGADDYLVKPFDLLELSARVKSMLRLKALQDALVEQNRALDLANKELEQKREELLRLSRTDGLTGLYNRRHFNERLEAELARAARYHAALSCVMVDIDHFKKVNDTYGHLFGDVVIKEVAQVLKKALRDVDVLARYGGEELVALLPETGPVDARRAAERVRAGVAGLELTCELKGKNVPVRCTASLGVATWPSPTLASPQALLGAADASLYRAKQGGRNRVEQHQD